MNNTSVAGRPNKTTKTEPSVKQSRTKNHQPPLQNAAF